MKTKSFLRNSMLVIFAAISVVSCNDVEEETEVLTDVYVVNRELDNEKRSANAYYAYANKDLISATVAIPNGGGNVELGIHSGSIFTLSKEPADSDYTTYSPVEGSYVFSVLDVDGVTHAVPDLLNFIGLDIPQFTKLKFSGSPFILETEWNAITEADGYFIKMFNPNGKLIFSSYSIAPNVLKYTITGSSNSGYWSETAVDGKPYTLELNAYTNDAEATSVNYVYNLSEVSIGQLQIIWGEN